MPYEERAFGRATEAGGQKQRRECWGAEEIGSKAVMQASQAMKAYFILSVMGSH